MREGEREGEREKEKESVCVGASVCLFAKLKCVRLRVVDYMFCD